MDEQGGSSSGDNSVSKVSNSSDWLYYPSGNLSPFAISAYNSAPRKHDRRYRAKLARDELMLKQICARAAFRVQSKSLRKKFSKYAAELGIIPDDYPRNIILPKEDPVIADGGKDVANSTVFKDEDGVKVIEAAHATTTANFI